MNLPQCPRCEGLCPPDHDRCPHCDHTRPTLLRTAAVAGAMSMTPMACYGAPGGYEPYESLTNVPRVACEQATGLFADDGDVYTQAATDDDLASHALGGHCSTTTGPERVFLYDPAEASGQSGKLSVIWTSGSEHSVYLVDQCGQTQPIACGEPTTSGRIDLSTSSLGELYIVVDAVDDYGGDAFELEVLFEPDASQ